MEREGSCVPVYAAMKSYILNVGDFILVHSITTRISLISFHINLNF